MDELGFFVSKNLHYDAIKNIFHAPMSFFDTTVSPGHLVQRILTPPQ